MIFVLMITTFVVTSFTIGYVLGEDAGARRSWTQYLEDTEDE